MSKTEEGLQRTLDEAEWSWLKPHAERNFLILVASSLDLVEVGQKLAEDDTKQVDEWITKGLISKPTKEQMEAWDAEPLKRFLSLVIQPYVLFQEARVH